jgi:diguanylate cyclase (GGDEF)-like protein
LAGRSPEGTILAAIVAFLLITGVVTARLGARMGDGAFAFFIAFGLVVIMIASQAANGPGQVAKGALALVVSTVMSAVFLERTRFLVGILVFLSGLLTVVAARAPAAVRPYDDVGSAVLGLVTVAGTIRLLRHRAITALTEARRGEVTDPLTGLFNRRGLERSGPDCWHQSARAGLPVAAFVVDIDHFKQINDTRGHAAGDEILRGLGQLLSAWTRPGAVAVRLGGEEFLVLCAMPPGHAPTVAERLRRAIERELAPITVSIGVYEAVPAEADPVPDAIWSAVNIADHALYLAKSTGRNRVVVSE